MKETIYEGWTEDNRAILPEVEAWWNVIVIIVKSVKLVNGFTVCHGPVEVTVPVYGDTDNPALRETQEKDSKYPRHYHAEICTQDALLHSGFVSFLICKGMLFPSQ